MRRGVNAKRKDATVTSPADLSVEEAGGVPHLIEEFNIFKLEGLIFDLTRKHDRYKSEMREEGSELDSTANPVTIEPNPNYGRPGVGAFKALQVIFYKLTEEGYPYPSTVSFTRREFERLRGSIGQGGYQMARTYQDLQQLETCRIHCSRKNKETGNFEWGQFYIVPKSWWSSPSGSKRDISQFTLQLDDDLIKNLNAFHYARFNWYRLRELMDSPIAMILYKRFFQNFSALMDKDGTATVKYFEKDYQDVCRHWLGGIKPLSYKSVILRDQLGKHIEAVQNSRLGRITVEKRKKGGGFKLRFTPQKGFFEDYQRLYVDHVQRPQLPFNRSSSQKDIQEPLQVIDYFYRQVGKAKSTFRDSEVDFARELLKEYSYTEVESLIDVAVRHAKRSGFNPYSFNIVQKYLPNWKKNRDQRAYRTLVKDKVSSCSLCDQNGYMTLIDPKDHNRAVAYECPHDAAQVELIEEQKGLKRL